MVDKVQPTRLLRHIAIDGALKSSSLVPVNFILLIQRATSKRCERDFGNITEHEYRERIRHLDVKKKAHVPRDMA